MDLSPITVEDRSLVESLLLENPFKADQVRFQGLEGNRLARFHAAKILGMSANSGSAAFKVRDREEIGVVGFLYESAHSSFFGKSVFSIQPVITYQLGRPTKVEIFGELLRRTPLSEASVIWTKVDERESDCIDAISEMKGRNCGTEVRLSRSLGGGDRVIDGGGIPIREAVGSDLGQLRDLAGESHRYSHYFRDPYLPVKKKLHLFPNYLQRKLESAKDPLYVTEDPTGGISGFSLLQEPENQIEAMGRKVGVIDFIAVRADCQGQGVGGILIDRSHRRLAEKGYEFVELKTMLDNLQAIGFYQRHGYRILSADVHFSIQPEGRAE